MEKVFFWLGVLFLLGGVAAACTYWAGIDEGAAIAFLLGGSALAVLLPVGIDWLGNWGVPGDGHGLDWARRD